MKKLRFYYSRPANVCEVSAIETEDHAIVAISDNRKHICKAPRITICGIYDDEANTMSFGVARCSYKDNFTRKLGRKISQGRAERTPFAVIPIDSRKVPDVFMDNAIDIENQILEMEYPIRLS